MCTGTHLAERVQRSACRRSPKLARLPNARHKSLRTSWRTCREGSRLAVLQSARSAGKLWQHFAFACCEDLAANVPLTVVENPPRHPPSGIFVR